METKKDFMLMVWVDGEMLEVNVADKETESSEDGRLSLLYLKDDTFRHADVSTRGIRLDSRNDFDPWPGQGCRDDARARFRGTLILSSRFFGIMDEL